MEFYDFNLKQPVTISVGPRTQVGHIVTSSTTFYLFACGGAQVKKLYANQDLLRAEAWACHHQYFLGGRGLGKIQDYNLRTKILPHIYHLVYFGPCHSFFACTDFGRRHLLPIVNQYNQGVPVGSKSEAMQTSYLPG